MNKVNLIVFVLCLSACPLLASSDNSPYVGFGMDYVSTDDFFNLPLDSSYGFYGCLGYRFDQIRLEGELRYSESTFENYTVDNEVMSYLANAYYDIPLNDSLNAYVMGGLGGANVKFSNDEVDENVLAWQVGIGLGYAISNQLTLDLGYRYFNALDVQPVTASTEDDLTIHNVQLGLRINF